MSRYAAVNVKFGADISQFSTAMQNAAREMNKMGEKMKEIGKTMSTHLTAPILALGAAAVWAFDKQAQAMGQVEAGIRSTGGAAGFTKERLLEMSEALQSVTTYEHGEILKGVTAQMLTFRNVTGPQFIQAQKAVLDMSTRLGDADLTTTSIRLGKALNMPIEGMTALKRVGVQFSESQKTMIKHFVETNQLAKAQEIILKELSVEFGGSAEAAANAGIGPLKQLKNEIEVAMEGFGKIILEYLNPFIQKLRDLIRGFEELSPSTKNTIVIIAGLAAAIGPLILAMGAIIQLLPMMMAGWAALTGPVGITIVVIAALVSSLYTLFDTKKELQTSESASNEVMKESNKQYEKQKETLDKLIETANNKNQSDKVRKEAIEKINALSPEYLGNITLETINTNKAKDAIDNYNISLKSKIKHQLLSLQHDKLIEKQAELQNSIDAEAEAESQKANKGSALTMAWKRMMGTDLESLKEQKKLLDDQLLNIQTLLENGFNAPPEIKKVKDNPEGISDAELKKIKAAEEKRWKVFIDSKKRTMDDIAQYNEREISDITNHQNNIDKLNTKGLKSQLQTDAAYKSQLDKSALDLDLSLSFQLETWRKHYQTLAQFTQQMNDLIITSVQNMIIDIASAFGENLVDKDPFKNLGNIMLGSLGKFMVALGSAMITLSTIFVAFKQAIATMQPEIAIPLGIAMVAAGAAISKIAANGMKGASSSGATSSYSGGSSSSGGNLVLESRVDGRDLVLSGRTTGYIKRR